LSSVTSLPYRGDFEPLHRAMVVDGICDDVLNIVPDLPLPGTLPSIVPSPSSVVAEDPNCDPTEEKINQIILRQNSSSTTIADFTPIIPAKYVKRIYSNVATCLVCEKPFIMCHCTNTVHGETRTSFFDYFL
jgi:hypothetical protein